VPGSEWKHIYTQQIVAVVKYCLSDELREPLLTANSFSQLLKTRLFAEYQCIQRIGGIAHYALYKSTYLLVFCLYCVVL